jgi:hypothetical protein
MELLRFIGGRPGASVDAEGDVSLTIPFSAGLVVVSTLGAVGAVGAASADAIVGGQ